MLGRVFPLVPVFTATYFRLFMDLQLNEFELDHQLKGFRLRGL